MSEAARSSDPVFPNDLSSLSPDEIYALRDAIMERARREIDPEGIGFDPVMFSTDDSSFFTTDDVTFKDWWDWVQQLTQVITYGTTRIGTALMAAGGAIAAAQLYGTPGGARWAGLTLSVSALAGGWFVVSAAMSRARAR